MLADIAAIEASQRFDRYWYLELYPDVAASGIDPIDHYVRHGVAEGRDPCPDFDTRFYLQQNPDVKQSGINPFRHYIEHGFREGRMAMPRGKLRTVVGPLVSVIIPIYAVEQYLAGCLDSVVKQNYHSLEIIVVDDGSPDRSHEIASAYAKRDLRIRILRRDNGGLGAARNTGVAAATGRYLTFVDSDDTLPRDAICRMVHSLQQTGSDFVVGSIRRLRNGRVMPADGWVREVHARDRTSLRLGDFPEILTDVFACNKLFRSDFFRKVVARFPEKIRYEDHEPSAKAYLSGTFDVLAATVYHWRVRSDGTSITQRKSDLNDLRDRLAVKRRVSQILAKVDVSTYEAWLVKAIGFDLRPYFEQVPRTDLDFFMELRGGMQFFAEKMTPRLWQRVRMIDRLPALAVLAGYRDDVGVAITRRDEYGYFVPSRLEGGAAYLDRNYLEGMALSPDDEYLKLGDADLSVVACATSLWWHGDRLELEGYAYLTNIEFDDDSWISARLISGNRPPIELALRKQNRPRIDREDKDAWNAHAKSGFATDIDPIKLQLDTDAAWRMEIAVGRVGLNHSSRTVLRDADVRGNLATDSASAVREGGARWVAGFEPDAGFELQCHISSGVLVDVIGTDGETVTIATAQSNPGTLVLTCETLRDRVEVTGMPAEVDGTIFRCKLPELRASDNREHRWEMHMCGDGAPRNLTYPGDRDNLEQAAPEHRRVGVLMNRDGTLSLTQRTWWAVADEVNVGPDTIAVRGRIDAPGVSMLSARLVGEMQVFEADPAELDPAAQRFEVRVPFDPAINSNKQAASSGTRAYSANADNSTGPNPSQETVQPTMQHWFGLRLSVVLQDKRSERWLRVATGLQHQLPAERTAPRHGLTIARTPRAAALRVRFHGPHRDDERGRLA